MDIEVLEDSNLYKSNQIKLKINNGEFIQLEELTINKDAIAWKVNMNSSFMIPWDKIVVQAIQAEPQRSIYFMIDESWEHEIQNNGNANDHEHIDGEDLDDEEPNITEFWLLPDDTSEIDNLYYILTQCGNNNPAEESESEEEFFEGEDMAQMNINDDDDNERFADAE